MPSWTTNPLILLRDAVLVASIAVVTFLGLGRWFGDYYRVPSGSMEPTLHGDATSGDIVVALVDGNEATLKRLRRKGDSIALEAANPAYETRIFGPDRVKVQGKLVGLLRRY